MTTLTEDAEDREIQKLYSDTLVAERALREAESATKSSKELAAASTSTSTQLLPTAHHAIDARSARAQLALAYESIILASCDFAENNAIDDKLWNRVVYPQIEELRGAVRRAQDASAPGTQQLQELASRVEDLAAALDHAEALYTGLISELRLQEDLEFEDLATVGARRFIEGETGIPTRSENILAHVHRHLIRLGDISRYRALAIDALSMATQPGREHTVDYEVASELYERALLLNPISGKPQCQISILTSYSDDPLNSAFWTCLSMASSQPHSLARNNLKTVYNRTAPKIEAMAAEKIQVGDTSEGAAQIGAARIHRLVRQAFYFENLPTVEHRPLYDSIRESVPALIRCTEAPNLVRRLMVCMIVAYEDLGHRWRVGGHHAPVKTTMRELQSVLACVVIDILTSSLSQAAEELSTSGWSALNDDDPAPKLSSVEALVAVPWLAKHIDDAIRHSNEYIEWYGEQFFAAEFHRDKVMSLVRAMSHLGNSALDAYVLEHLECLPEDLDLLGAVPFRNFYSQLDQQSILDAVLACPPGSRVQGLSSSSTTEQLLSRALLLARSFVEKDLLAFDSSTGSYVVLGSRERQQRAKVTRKIPKHRPREESEEAEPLPLVPVVIPLDILTDHPDRVRAWISSGAAAMVVPSSAWDLAEKSDKAGLAALVSGSHDPLKFRKQNQGEQAPVEDALALAGLSDVSPQHRSVLSLCLYLFGESDGFDEDPDSRGVLVTEDSQLMRLAGACGLPVLSPRQMDVWAKRQRRLADLAAKTKSLAAKGSPLRR